MLINANAYSASTLDKAQGQECHRLSVLKKEAC